MKKYILILSILLFSSNIYAAGETVSSLTPITSLTGTDIFYVVHSGSKNITWTNVLRSIESTGIHPIGTFSSPTTANPYAISATNCYSSSLYYGATGQINLPTAVAGMNLIIYNTGAFTITVNPQDTDVIVLAGAPLSAGISIVIASGAGNYITLISDESNHWITLGSNGTITQGS